MHAPLKGRIEMVRRDDALAKNRRLCPDGVICEDIVQTPHCAGVRWRQQVLRRCLCDAQRAFGSERSSC